MEINNDLLLKAVRAGIPAEEPSVSLYVLHDRFIYYRGFDLRAALEAVAPAIRAAAMEDAIAEVRRLATTFNAQETQSEKGWRLAVLAAVSALEVAAVRAAKGTA